MKGLEVNELKKTYKNGFEALKGVSFTIDQGDFFALLGPNGAGKTTLIGILTSLVVKTSGQIKIFGHNVDDDFNVAKSYIGVVPQEFNFNIFETVSRVLINQAGYYGIPRHEAKKRAKHYLKRLGIWDKRDDIVRYLSGGMKRRLMIARALIHEPKMLILDEPTAGVDIELRRSMWDFLQEVNQKGITIILTTHYLEEAESNCRNLAIIDNGEIVESSSLDEFLKRLDRESLVMYLKEPLEIAPQVSGCRTKLLDETTIEVEVPRDLGVSHVFSQLHAQQISVISMRNKINRLEELFIKLTNRE